MDVSQFLKKFQAVGLLTHLLDDLIGSVEPMVQLFTRPLSKYVLAQKLEYITDSKLSGLCAPIGVLVQSCGGLP